MTTDFDDDYDISVQCPHIAFDIEQFLIEHPDANFQVLAEAIRGADNVYGGVTVYDVTATRLELHPDSPLDWNCTPTVPSTKPTTIKSLT